MIRPHRRGEDRRFRFVASARSHPALRMRAPRAAALRARSLRSLRETVHPSHSSAPRSAARFPRPRRRPSRRSGARMRLRAVPRRRAKPPHRALRSAAHPLDSRDGDGDGFQSVGGTRNVYRHRQRRDRERPLQSRPGDHPQPAQWEVRPSEPLDCVYRVARCLPWSLSLPRWIAALSREPDPLASCPIFGKGVRRQWQLEAVLEKFDPWPRIDKVAQHGDPTDRSRP